MEVHSLCRSSGGSSPLEGPGRPGALDRYFEGKRICLPRAQPSPLGGNNARGCEDCLYLNIRRPETDEKDLPVYVWIHGGGNSIGSADMVPDYRGDTLASRGNPVFVSINYRLGPFGWFTHSVLRTGLPEDKDDDSGNYGTLDIIRALEWIQENIVYFGGSGGMLGIPTIFTDGTVILKSGYETLRDGSYPSKIPIILGSKADEPLLFPTFSPDYRGKDELFDLVSKLGSVNWKSDMDYLIRFIYTGNPCAGENPGELPL